MHYLLVQHVYILMFGPADLAVYLKLHAVVVESSDPGRGGQCGQSCGKEILLIESCRLIHCYAESIVVAEIGKIYTIETAEILIVLFDVSDHVKHVFRSICFTEHDHRGPQHGYKRIHPEIVETLACEIVYVSMYEEILHAVHVLQQIVGVTEVVSVHQQSDIIGRQSVRLASIQIVPVLGSSAIAGFIVYDHIINRGWIVPLVHGALVGDHCDGQI